MWQAHYLKKGVTVTTDKQEDPLDLGKNYPISAILCSWEMTSGVAEDAAFANEAHLQVLKDGSEKIIDEQFGQIIALDQLLMPAAYKIADLGADATGYYLAIIPFGRYIGDPEYFLDPRGFASLDLVITQPTHTATTLAVYNVVLIRELDAARGSRGYNKFTNKRIYTAAAATQYIELDRRHKYAAIVIGEMNGADSDLLSVISEVKVDCDAGVFSPVDLKETDLTLLTRIPTKIDVGTDPATLAAMTNFLACNWVNPWIGEEFLLDAPKYGRVELEILGAADGTIRVGALELVRPGETP